MSRRIAIDWVTGRSLDGMELLIVWLNVQSGHHKLSEVEDRLRLRVVPAVIVPTEKEGTGSRWGACAPVFGCDHGGAMAPHLNLAYSTSIGARVLMPPRREGACSYELPALTLRGLAVFAQLRCPHV